MKSTKILLVACVFLILITMMGIVAAGTPNQDGTCITPPDDYFIKDAPNLNGQPVHEGVQNGFTFWIPNTANYPHFGGSGLPLTFKLGQSHYDQTKIAMGKMWYCDSLPDFRFDPALNPDWKPTIGVSTVLPTGVSENPETSVYVMQHGTKFD